MITKPFRQRCASPTVNVSDDLYRKLVRIAVASNRPLRDVFSEMIIAALDAAESRGRS